MRNSNSGFTLLELLMVVIIIAILAALALPGYYRAVERARSAEAITHLGVIRGAVQRYCVENSSAVNPTSFADLDVTVPAAGTTQWDYAWNGAVTCVAGGQAQGTDFVATRNGGPCIGSTITMTWPPANVGQSIFTTNWAAGTPCA